MVNASPIFFAIVLVATSFGCSSTERRRDGGASDAGSTDGQILDAAYCGAVADPIRGPCGFVGSAAYFTFYDGCNSCTCSAGPDASNRYCTARACVGDAGASDVYCVTTGAPIPAGQVAGTMYCDPEGRLFVASCLPDAGP